MRHIKSARNESRLTRRSPQWYYHAMMLPGMVFILLFEFVPTAGIVMAFQDFKPAKGIFGSEWVGFKHFIRMFSDPNVYRLVRNTIVISVGKLAANMLVSIAFAILLNEIRVRWLKKAVQTIVYLPHFLSWALLAPIIMLLLANDGPINDFLQFLGFDPIQFIGNKDTFRPLLILTSVWKGFGYSSIIYLAAITGVDPGLHEAAVIDGASWWQRVLHVTLPGMLSIIILVLAIDVSNVLSAGFDQVFNLYSVRVYETGDIIDTYVYRMGLVDRQYSFSTAIGMFKSIIGLILMLAVNGFSKKFLDRTVF